MKIERSSLLHRGQGSDACPLADGRFFLRLFAREGDVLEAYVVYGDRGASSTPVPLSEKPMKKVAASEGRETFEVFLSHVPERLFYAFRLVGREETLYFLDGFVRPSIENQSCGGKTIDNREEFFTYPYDLRSERISLPPWWEKANVYNIFPDSFVCGRKKSVQAPSRVGGTFKDVEEKLPYLKDLGIDCLYLNPIFKAASYHRYDTSEYFSCDPALGGDEAFLSLVQAAHRLGLKVMVDGVFNHTGRAFFAFRDIEEKGDKSPYLPWYYRVSFPLFKADGFPNYACFGYCPAMPKLDTSNPDVIAYFAQGAADFSRRFQIDGWRLDVANEVDKSFWRSFKKEVLLARPSSVFLAEIWGGAEAWLAHDLFDSTMNYEFARIARFFFAYGKLDAQGLSDELNRLLDRYAPPFVRAQLNLLDSHDVPRFHSLIQGDPRKYRSALALLYLFPGVPSLFYGDEKGLDGIVENDYRRAMEWDPSPFEEDIKRLIGLRNTLPPTRPSIEAAEDVFELRYRSKEGCFAVLLAGNRQVSVQLPPRATILFQNGFEDGCLLPFGCLAYRLS